MLKARIIALQRLPTADSEVPDSRRVFVRVVFQRQLPVGLPDVVLSRGVRPQCKASQGLRSSWWLVPLSSAQLQCPEVLRESLSRILAMWRDISDHFT